jgi:hypothetical protein
MPKEKQNEPGWVGFREKTKLEKDSNRLLLQKQAPKATGR